MAVKKLVIWVIILLVALPATGIVAFLVYLHVLYYDYVKTPIGYIRNDRFVVGLYQECFTESANCRPFLTVVDMDSYRRREQRVFVLAGQRGRLKRFVFTSKTMLRVTVETAAARERTYDISLSTRDILAVDLDKGGI